MLQNQLWPDCKDNSQILLIMQSWDICKEWTKPWEHFPLWYQASVTNIRPTLHNTQYSQRLLCQNLNKLFTLIQCHIISFCISCLTLLDIIYFLSQYPSVWIFCVKVEVSVYFNRFTSYECVTSWIRLRLKNTFPYTFKKKHHHHHL
jgi:hypothetical protein